LVKLILKAFSAERVERFLWLCAQMKKFPVNNQKDGKSNFEIIINRRND
jgi:hypothetical protein